MIIRRIKRLFLFLFVMLVVKIQAQSVLTLGTFHFTFPNLDAVQFEESKQINVLDSKFQEEINLLVQKLAVFEPTIIVIERPEKMQQKIDSLYDEYLMGRYQLGRSEDQQIGFRLAKILGIKKLYCVDEWGSFNEPILKLMEDDESETYLRFEESFCKNPDSAKIFHQNSVFKIKGIIPELIQLNTEENIKKSLGNYLIGHFKYESEERDFTGVDFETGRWFNRNLKIFRNIQRIQTQVSDRILVIYGAGHLNILNYLFECSPEYKLLRTNDYLE